MVLTRRHLLAALSGSLLVVNVAIAAPVAKSFETEIFEAALAAKRPILVEISAPWCPVCAIQKEHLAALLTDPRYADLVFLEVDFDSRKDVVRALGAQTQSTLIAYGGGAEVTRSVGETDRSRIGALLDSAVAAAGE